MNLHKQLLTKNDCYKQASVMVPSGILIHSTGVNNPYIKRYVQPDDGLLGTNIYGNHWNMSSYEFRHTLGSEPVCVHAFIGKLNDGSIATYQTLPWNYRCWGCGSGWRGSYNNSHIQVEICEADLYDAEYFQSMYKEAVEFCAYICTEYHILVENITCHHDAGKAGFASGHVDPMHWWVHFSKTMDDFRSDVQSCIATGNFLPDDDPTQEEFNAMADAFFLSLSDGNPASWSENSRVWAESNGIISGDGQGNKQYTGFTNREMMAVICSRLYDLCCRDMAVAKIEDELNDEVSAPSDSVRHINKEGLEMIKFFESCSLIACKALASEEHWSIGWGHYGPDVVPGSTITQAQADALLAKDLEYFEKAVANPKYVPFTAELSDNQFSALISFAYNCGVGSLQRLCRGRSIDQIPQHMMEYTHSGGAYITGLARRRQAEVELFCKESDDIVTQAKFNEMMNNYLNDLANKEPAEWSAPARQWAESTGLIVGDQYGNKSYCSFLTREQMTVFMQRLYSMLMEQVNR